MSVFVLNNVRGKNENFILDLVTVAGRTDVTLQNVKYSVV